MNIWLQVWGGEEGWGRKRELVELVQSLRFDLRVYAMALHQVHPIYTLYFLSQTSCLHVSSLYMQPVVPCLWLPRISAPKPHDHPLGTSDG